MYDDNCNNNDRVADDSVIIMRAHGVFMAAVLVMAAAVLCLLRMQSRYSLQPSNADCVLVYGGTREDSDSVLLLRLATSDGSSSDGNSSSGGNSGDANLLRHELPLPKGPDDNSPDVIRRTVRMPTLAIP